MRYALITGGSRGIGAAAARMFARRNWGVAVGYEHSQSSALALVRVLLRGMFGPSWPKRLMGERMPPPETDQDTPPESNTLTE